jgi:hypothetical protein
MFHHCSAEKKDYCTSTTRKLLIPARICSFSLVQRITDGRNSNLQGKLNDTGVCFIINGLNSASVSKARAIGASISVYSRLIEL